MLGRPICLPQLFQQPLLTVGPLPPPSRTASAQRPTASQGPLQPQAVAAEEMPAVPSTSEPASLYFAWSPRVLAVLPCRPPGSC